MIRRLLYLVAGAIVLFLVLQRWPKPDSRFEATNLHATAFARHLLSRGAWQTHEAPSGHIHYRADSHAARTTAAIAQSVDSARQAVLAFLQMTDPTPIEVFFVDSRAQMQELVGRPIGGMVQSGERTALMVYSNTYSPFVVHELTHLYTHNAWGAPRNGRWVSEGLAALVAGKCQGHTIAQLVKGLHDDGRLHRWAQLATHFDRIDEIAGNLQAASMVEFVRGRGGIRAVRDLWTSEGFVVVERVFRKPITEIERDWLVSVQTVPQGAQLDLPRLQARGCVTS